MDREQSGVSLLFRDFSMIIVRYFRQRLFYVGLVVALILGGAPYPLNAEVLTSDEQQDLQLAMTYQQKPGLIDRLTGNTLTKKGRDYYKKCIESPVIDSVELVKRQENTKVFIKDELLEQKVKRALKRFSCHEQSLCSLSDKNNPIVTTIVNSFYFKMAALKWLNKYPAGLELGLAAHIGQLAVPSVEHFVMHYLTTFLVGDTSSGHSCGVAHDHHGHEDHGHSHHGHHHHCDGHGHGVITPVLSPKKLYANYALNAIHIGMHIINIKNLFDEISTEAVIIRQMQKQLMEVRACILAARSLYNCVKTNDQLSSSVEGFDALKSLFDKKGNNNSVQLREFLTLIQSKTFAGKPSFFSRPGVILRTYALGRMVATELHDKLIAVAVLDFHRSCAQLYKDYQHTATPFNFVCYKDELTPSLKISRFWNPLFDQPQIVDATLAFGTENPAVAIVTGPNKAGKSTNLSAIVLSVVLAQTIGIVPAEHCALTPFACIRTGFNMNNRVHEGQSLLSASLDFAHMVLHDVHSLMQGQYALVVVDELFNSTEYYKGASLAMQFMQELGKTANVLTIMATHFGSLTELEQQTPAHYRNFKAERRQQGSAAQEYAIMRGISNGNDALSLISNDDLAFTIKK